VPAALTGLVAVSAILHWLAGRNLRVLWIMPDEALYGERALAFWHGGITLHGQGSGYSVLYPLVAGIPLSLGSLATGYAALKPVQAIIVSLVALPVYVYARRLMPPAFALVAAGLALASPLLLYSGLVMTEVLYYPLAAWTLLAAARAIETASWRDQAYALVLIGLSVLTRTQAIVFLPVLALALVVDALLGRDLRRLRRFPLVWAALGLAAVLAITATRILGAYADTLRHGYPLAAGLRWTGEHLMWAVVETGVVPAVALLMLTLRAVRPGGLDGRARALVAVALAAVTLVSLQVGLFASRYAPHLLGRDLAALPPLLFVVLALWLSRGAPRGRASAAVAAGLLLLGVAFTPWDRLVDAAAIPDTFDLTLLERIGPHASAWAVPAFVVVSLALAVCVPRRLRLLLPALVLATLCLASVVAAGQVRDQVRFDQVNLVGADPSWIDHATDGPVAELYDGERYWNGVWQTLFWNRNVRDVVSLAPTRVPGPLGQRVVRLGPDGRLGTDAHYVVASDPHRLVGEPVAHLAQQTIEQSGMTLWRVDPPARLSYVIRGIQANGDMTEPAHDTVYDCAGGQLQLTLLPKSTNVVTIALDGHVVLRAHIGGLDYWNGTVNVPPSPTPRVCKFTIRGQYLLGSTRVDFVRSS